jgi:LysM repeat protein
MLESGGDSNNQDGRGSRTPPDEQQMRIGRSRVARGFDPLSDDAPLGVTGPGGFVGTSSNDATFGAGNRAAGSSAGQADQTQIGVRRNWPEQAPAGEPVRCHFLRSVGADGKLADPQKTAVPTHRCAAYGDPLPLSLRQQELVCLQRVHISCPRYVRGTLLANEAQPQAEATEKRAGGVPVLTLGGIGLVVAAVLILLSAVLGIGPLGGGSPASHPPIAIATPTATPTATPSASPSPTAQPSPSTSASASVKPTLTPKPTATPKPTSSWPPGATASRMNLLVPCDAQANCWVYTVRGAGPPPSGNGSKVADNLSGIAVFFGVKANDIRALNGMSGTDVIHPGEKLKIPPPTR